MSDKKRFLHAIAMPVAVELMNQLRPGCQVIEIAGSLRRKKSLVGDIEIAFVPLYIREPDGLFETKPVSVAGAKIELWLAQGVITKRLATTGKISSWGENNKHAVHVASGISVDFFSEPDILDWPRTLAIRTGPKEFNVLLMSSAPRNGHNAHAYGEALHKIPTGERVIAKTERAFIEICGVEYREPNER